MMRKHTVGFLGAGSMGGAILGAMLRKAKASHGAHSTNNARSNYLSELKRVLVFDPAIVKSASYRNEYMDKLQKLAPAGLSIEPVTSELELAENSTVSILGVKPQMAADVLTPLRGRWGAKNFLEHEQLGLPGNVVISVLGGTDLASLRNLIFSDLSEPHQHATAIVRTMPNTGLLAQRGATCYATLPVDPPTPEGVTDAPPRYAPSGPLQEYAHDATEAILGAGGFIDSVTEDQLLGVTVVSGVGPAWMSTLLEAMSDGGVAAGLPRPLSTKIAIETAIGSAAMLSAGGPCKQPSELKYLCMTPGGTTVAGLNVVESKNLRGAVLAAVHGAATRNEELKKESRDQKAKPASKRRSASAKKKAAAKA